MARYSGAIYRPLAAKQGEPAMRKHDVVCLHTMVGNLSGTDTMFHKDGWTGTESHFGVGGIWGPDAAKGYDGKVFQWQDTTFSADANLEGNPRVISIETADNAPGLVRDIRPWTAKQLDAIVKLVAWACRTHDIPPVLIPDSKPTRRGIGYHRQGCEHSSGVGRVPGFLVAGGERWSSSKGKECPGPQRIAQLQAIVIPRVKALLVPAPAPAKPPVEAAVSESDYVLELKTQYQVDTMNSNGANPPFKIGDELDLRRLWMWGGPNWERLQHQMLGLLAEQKDQGLQLQRIEDHLAILSATMNPPTPTGASRTV